MKFTNPLAAAAAWAERMSNPQAVEQRKQQESAQRRAQEAEQPPIPEEEATPEAGEPPVAPPPPEEKSPQLGDERRSAVWAGCILLGVGCSIVAFILGMIR